MSLEKTVLILGANSDVARELIQQYYNLGYFVIAASRNTKALMTFAEERKLDNARVQIIFFDAVDFASHQKFYDGLSRKPQIVIYAAGFLKNNEEALRDWEGTYQMMKVHYCGAVSILNIVINDSSNTKLERIIGLSSLSGVRGRKSNFIYGSTKAAFTQYLAGLRQYLAKRNVIVTVIVAGYIRSKMTAGLNLPDSLMLEPTFIANAVVRANNKFVHVPGWKWKIIYQILRVLPESLVAKLP